MLNIDVNMFLSFYKKTMRNDITLFDFDFIFDFIIFYMDIIEKAGKYLVVIDKNDDRWIKS